MEDSLDPRPPPAPLSPNDGEGRVAQNWDIPSLSPSEAIVLDQDEVLGPLLRAQLAPPQWETLDLLPTPIP